MSSIPPNTITTADKTAEKITAAAVNPFCPRFFGRDPQTKRFFWQKISPCSMALEGVCVDIHNHKHFWDCDVCGTSFKLSLPEVTDENKWCPTCAQ